MSDDIEREERAVNLTIAEADWLASEVSRASTDTLVPGAAERLRALARKLRAEPGELAPVDHPRPVLLAHVIGRPHWQLAPVREWRGMRLYEADNQEPVAAIDEEGHVLGARPDRLPRILFADVPVMLHLTCGISIAPLADGGEALAALDPATAVRPSQP